MKYRTTDEIRRVWLDFFKEKGHFEEPSASLIPYDDPTLLWINAGVAALKKYFDGSETPPYRRIVNSQKSLRTNDIENVGKTSRHHTFFEMLGNFSIGDYFRQDVIPWAYELLTSEKYFGFDKNKLYITYYPDDLETRDLWIKCGMDESHLLPNKDNFWEIGEGPCGPDTEINYDRGEKYDPEGLGTKLITEDIENDRFIEVWNIVFSQFNSKPGLKRSEYPLLPYKNIDTGCSLERLACIIQNVETNYETDFFLPIIKEIEKNSNLKYEGENKFYYRVVADHIRSLVFTLADGASFSNEGRGYVVRRLLRRASKFSKTLGLKTGFLAHLVDIVVEAMKEYYPYLLEKKEKIAKMIKSEEDNFLKVLTKGEKYLNEYLEDQSIKVLSGEVCFKLSDTFGFPIELTTELAHKANKEVDLDKFKELLNKQKELARASRQTMDSFKSQNKDLMEFKGESLFTYDDKVIKGKSIWLFENGKKVDEIKEEGIVIFDKTNFYAESGGQIADTGFIKNKVCEAEVYNCQKTPNKQNMLFVKVSYGSIKIGASFEQHPDFAKRMRTRKNHSACHLLQAALQKVVDPNIKQEGSFNSDEMTRFDFSLDRKLTQDEITAVEELVNKEIQKAHQTDASIYSKEDALKTGAMHLFSEKYGDKVRVVSFGEFSKEFCGGCHVANTSDINLFVIASEQAVASGVRRIIGYTGLKAYKFLKEKDLLLNNIAKDLGLTSQKEVEFKLNQNKKEVSEMKKKIQALESKITSLLSGNLSNTSSSEKVANYNFYLFETKDFSHNQLVELANTTKSNDKEALVLILNSNEDKVDVCVGLSDISKHKAGDLVRLVSQTLGGSGGGKPDLAFGGAKDLSNKSKAIELLKETISK